MASLKDSGHQPYFQETNPAPTGQFTLPFDLNYELDLWGQVRRTVAASREEVQATDADLATANLSLHVRAVCPWTFWESWNPKPMCR